MKLRTPLVALGLIGSLACEDKSSTASSKASEPAPKTEPDEPDEPDEPAPPPPTREPPKHPEHDGEFAALHADCELPYVDHDFALPPVAPGLAREPGKDSGAIVHAHLTEAGLQVGYSKSQIERYRMVVVDIDVGRLGAESKRKGEPTTTIELWVHAAPNVSVAEVGTVLLLNEFVDDGDVLEVGDIMPVRVVMETQAPASSRSYRRPELARDLYDAVTEDKPLGLALRKRLMPALDACSPLHEQLMQAAMLRGAQQCRATVAAFESGRSSCPKLDLDELSTLIAVAHRPQLEPRLRETAAVRIDWSLPPVGEPDQSWGELLPNWRPDPSSGAFPPLATAPGQTVDPDGELAIAMMNLCTGYNDGCEVTKALLGADAVARWKSAGRATGKL